MTTSHRGPLKRVVAGVTAGLLAFSGLALAATPASAQAGFNFERLSGPDRFATAADIAVKTFGTADTVLLATGVKFPDALTGNYLAGATGNTPILLTLPDAVPPATRDALRTLGATKVIILGGTTAVSPAVENDLKANYTVERLGGSDRYATAEILAKRATSDTGTVGMVPASASATGTVGLRTAILGNGEAYPDVLAAGPLGYARGLPVTITFPNVLRPETRRVLVDLNIEQVIIVGGTDAISASVETEVETLTGNAARRISGPDRFETAVAIADFAYNELDFDVTHVNLARGDDAKPTPGAPAQGFADALTGGPHGGDDVSPIVLTNPNNLPPATEALLKRRCPTLLDGHIFGGDRAVSPAVAAAADAAASICAPAPGRVTVTAADTTFDAGNPATGTITISMGTVATITVAGCGVTTQPVTDSDLGTAGFQFSVDIPGDQPAGQCTLTFTTTFTDGVVETDPVVITVSRLQALSARTSPA